MSRELTLVILAAGIGRRYGKDKQIAGVGPCGEWLLEYAIHDAWAAGFTRLLIVIRAPLRDALQQKLMPHLRVRGRAELHLIEQSSQKVPAGCRLLADRNKPLGTGHALWSCSELLHAPFAVINADDYYGRDAFNLLAEHFRGRGGPAMVGYPLRASLSPYGGVNRGICRIAEDGCLSGVEEFVEIRERDGTLHGRSPAGIATRLGPEAIASLNCWGLLPDFLSDLESGLIEFLQRARNDEEYFLPAAIDRHLARSGQRLTVLRSEGEWLGLTYREDLQRVAARLAVMHAAGIYPTPLWESGGR